MHDLSMSGVRPAEGVVELEWSGVSEGMLADDCPRGVRLIWLSGDGKTLGAEIGVCGCQNGGHVAGTCIFKHACWCGAIRRVGDGGAVLGRSDIEKSPGAEEEVESSR